MQKTFHQSRKATPHQALMNQALLDTHQNDWRIQLQAWAASGALVNTTAWALGLDAAPEPLRGLSSRLAAGDWSDIPKVEILSESGIGGAAGAWAESTQTIYLNSGWLSGASKEEVVAVLTEEFGHYLDSRFTNEDTLGDEGELIAASLLERDLSPVALQNILTENDQVFLILASGDRLLAEAAFINGNDFQNFLTGTNDRDIIHCLGGDDFATGEAGNDDIYGENGNDNINGNDGNDFIDGGFGDDILSGDDGDDRLFGEEGNDDLTGGIGNDFLEGGDGDDRLFGDIGDDYLDGGLSDRGSGAPGVFSGIDYMRGGTGNDTYRIYDSVDILEERPSEGVDTIVSDISYTLPVNFEILRLSEGSSSINAINGIGNSLDNRLYGNAANNTLNGGAGADTMEGNLGNDTYVVDNIADRAIETANQGLDTVRTSVSYALMSSVENLDLTGNKAINGIGNNLNNTIRGNSNRNILRGLGGNDVLIGQGAKDTMTGGLGRDTFRYESLRDSLPGPLRQDVITDFQMAAGDRIDLQPIDANLRVGGNQAFRWIGARAFSGVAGQLRYAGGLLSGDVNGDRRSDFEIQLLGRPPVPAAGILL